MQVSVPVGVGAMAAIIGLVDDTINATCATISRSNEHVVLAVNYNSPGQVVIAGHSAAVEEAVVALKEAGAKRALPLPVSAPFHTPLMTHAGDVLREVRATTDLRDPLIPVISNVDAQAQQTASAIRDLLVQQVSAPVQWTGCVATMIDMGCERFVECGPGKVLSGLVKRIDKSKPCSVVETPDDMGTTLAELG